MSDDSTNPSAPPAVGTAAPTTQLFPLIDNDANRGNALICKTLGVLNKHGHKDSDLHSKIKNKLLKTVDAIHEAMVRAKKIVVDDNGTKCLRLTVLKLNEQLWNETGSYLIFLGNRKKVGAAFSESEGGLYSRIMDQFDEEEQQLEDGNAFVCMTFDKMLELAEQYSELKKIVMELMGICPAFCGFYDDKEGQHREKLFKHCLIAVFESYFAFVIEGSDPGFIAERILNLGSGAIWRYLKMPSKKSNKTAINWLNLLPDDLQVYVLQTWETYIAAIQASIREKGMTDSNEVMAMLREDLYQNYLKRHTTYSIWGHGGPNRSGTCLLGEGPFSDALYCPIFAEVKAVAESILQLMEAHTKGKLSRAEAKSQFKSLLGTIAKNHTKAYVESDDEALRAGGEKMLSALICKAKEQPKRTALIFTEKWLVDKYNKDYWDDITRGGETCDVKTVMPDNEGKPTTAGTLYKIPLDGMHCKTLLIFVGCSSHVTLGYGAPMPTRLSQASKQIATSSVLEEAGLNDKGSTDKLVKRFRFFFINAEGPFGNIFGDGVDSNRELRFYFAVRLALPPGYYITSIRTGVFALANEICPGMLKHHAVTLMVVMGYEQFCNFLRLHCDLDLGPVEQLKERLEEMSRESDKRRRLAFDEILKVLQKKAEERTEDDFEKLEESRALIDSTRTSKTSREHDGAKMLVMTLTENPTNDDITEVAEGVYNILASHITTPTKKARKLRRFYIEVTNDFEQSVIGGLFAATLVIQNKERFGGETNAFHAPSAAVEELID